MSEKIIGWDSVEGMLRSFGEDPTAHGLPTEEEVLLAYYTYEDYSGSAFVLYQKDGKLFEVHGSHCSCYGLEGQWEPEETTYAALSMRPWHQMEQIAGMDRTRFLLYVVSRLRPDGECEAGAEPAGEQPAGSPASGREEGGRHPVAKRRRPPVTCARRSHHTTYADTRNLPYVLESAARFAACRHRASSRYG